MDAIAGLLCRTLHPPPPEQVGKLKAENEHSDQGRVIEKPKEHRINDN